MSYAKQHELGLAGLALLRNWLRGNKAVTKAVIDDMRTLINTPGKTLFPNQKEVGRYGIRSGYEAWAATYDSIPNLLIEIEEPIVKSLLREFSPGKVLDAACGTGRYSTFLHSLGHTVIGVDLSLAMLDQAKAKDQQINFIQGDLIALPLKDKSIDLAVCALALTHFSTIEQPLSEVSRVVKPGGHILISDIHPWLVVLGGQAEFQDKAGKRGFIHNDIHWHSSYLQAFNRIGLKVLKCLEPTIAQEHLKLAQKGFDLSEKTVRSAFLGLPAALVWVLEKPQGKKTNVDDYKASSK